MTWRGYQKLVMLWGIVAVLLAGLACDDQLPSAFKKDNGAVMSEMDARACHYLSRPLSVADTIVVGNDTTYSTRNLHLAVSAIPLNLPLSQAWVNASDSLVEALFQVLIPDTTLLITNAAGSDTVFARYLNPSPGKPSYFFISWDLNEQNYDAYIEMELLQRDGNRVRLQSNQIDLATIAGCTQTAEIDGQPVALPKIRARLVYQLTEAQYLVRFYVSEPGTVGPFRLVILHNEL